MKIMNNTTKNNLIDKMLRIIDYSKKQDYKMGLCSVLAMTVTIGIGISDATEYSEFYGLMNSHFEDTDNSFKFLDGKSPMEVEDAQEWYKPRVEFLNKLKSIII